MGNFKGFAATGLQVFGAICLMAAPALAGKPSCAKDRRAVPVQIQSLIAESSRRIHVVSSPAIYQGMIAETAYIILRDEAGVETWAPNSISTADLSDVYVEGLQPGKKYTVIAQPGIKCATASAPMTIQMPLDQPEANPPVIGMLKFQWVGFLAYFPELTIPISDDTGVQGYRVWLDGQLMGEYVSSEFKAWTNATGNYVRLQNGQNYPFTLSDSWVGRTVNVTVEATDYLGNVSQKSQTMTFAY